MNAIINIRALTMAASISLFLTYSCQKEDNSVTDLPPDEEISVIDYDGNIYASVTIGTQTWISENLKSRRFLNGDSIPTTSADISDESEPKYQWAYNNNENNVSVYGRLYTWNVVTDSRKICPEGWHVPSDAEWETLISYLGGRASGGKLKEEGTEYWFSPNTGATNESGFTAVPGGYLSYDAEFVSIGISSYFWSSTPDNDRSWGQRLHYNDSISERWSFNREAGVSVRCLKD